MKFHLYCQYAVLGSILALAGAGCNETDSSLADPVTSVALVAANVSQCPAGGQVVETYSDTNGNGILDPGEPILSESPVCNGATGANGNDGAPGEQGLQGNGAGIQVQADTSGACPAGGLVLTTFIDSNNNGLLDSSEQVTSISTVCNGVNGINGTNGTNGSNGNSFSVSETTATATQCAAGGLILSVQEFDGNGHPVPNFATSTTVCNGTNGTNGMNGTSVVFTTTVATAQQCATGGNVIVMASDTAGTGSYSVTDANQESVLVCNGATGAQGATGATGAQGAAAPVSPFATIAPIMPCSAASSPWKEVLLCMADGNILADFSDNASGLNTRLSFIPAGSYEDTDASGCNFNVASDSHGGLTVSWGAGSNQYATWGAGSYDCKAN